MIKQIIAHKTMTLIVTGIPNNNRMSYFLLLDNIALKVKFEKQTEQHKTSKII